MSKVLDLQRPSFTELMVALKDEGPKSQGVIAMWVDDRVHFRISGFKERNDLFLICGLLDWIKADLLADVT